MGAMAQKPPKKPNKKSGSRGLHVNVKTAAKRSNSSARWLARQLNDPYVTKAKQEGYRSRAAFKLLDLDEKFHLLKPGMRVVDLGCAPGGWAQVAVAKVGPHGRVIGCDLLEVPPIPGATLIVQDFLTEDAPEVMKALLKQGVASGQPVHHSFSDGGSPVASKEEVSRVRNPESSKEGLTSGVAASAVLPPQHPAPSTQHPSRGLADLVMSDMAANTTGHGPTDHIRIIHLCEMAYHFAVEILAPGGTFICKVRKGGTESDLLKLMQRDFTSVKHAKPKSSRADSAESYVVAMGFRG